MEFEGSRRNVLKVRWKIRSSFPFRNVCIRIVKRKWGKIRKKKYKTDNWLFICFDSVKYSDENELGKTPTKYKMKFANLFVLDLNSKLSHNLVRQPWTLENK